MLNTITITDNVDHWLVYFPPKDETREIFKDKDSSEVSYGDFRIECKNVYENGEMKPEFRIFKEQSQIAHFILMNYHIEIVIPE